MSGTVAGTPVDPVVAGAAARAAHLLARDGLRGAASAKRGTLQSYSQHAIAVAAAAAKMAATLAGSGVDVAGAWAEIFEGEEWLLGFLAGLVHDHNKAWGPGERQSLLRLVATIAGEYVLLSDGDAERLLEDLYAVAEAAEQGYNAATVAGGLAALAAVTALADRLASATSLSEAYAAVLSPEDRYRYGVELLGQAGYRFRTLLATRPSILVAEASGEIAARVAEKGCRAILVYHDGMLLLCPEGAGLSYSEAAQAIEERLRRLLQGETGAQALEAIERVYRVAEEHAARAAGYAAQLGSGCEKARELLDKVKGFADCGRRGGKAKDCGMAEAVAALAALVASGCISPSEAATLWDDVRRVFGNRLQKKNYVGNAKPLSDAAKSYGVGLLELLRRLVKEGRLAEAAGVLAALAAGKPGDREAALIADAVGDEGLARRLREMKTHAFPVLLGIFMRLLREGGVEPLLGPLGEAMGGLGVGPGDALSSFSLYYACSSIGGTVFTDKDKVCWHLPEPRAYCSVCRAPLPGVEAAYPFREYGEKLGLSKGFSELWTSDEPPLVSIEKSSLARVTGVEYGRLVCPACVYDAARIASGLGLTAPRRRAFTLLVYAMHPVASPEQLELARAAVSLLSPPGGRRALDRLAESLAEGPLGQGRLAVVDFFAAKVVAHIAALGLDAYIDGDRLKQATPSLQHAAAVAYTAGPLLALLGGQVAAASSLASTRQLKSMLNMGRPLLYVEEAVAAAGYRGGAAALLSFAERAAPLVEGVRVSDRPRLLEGYLVQLESLAAYPPAALLAPPRPGLSERASYQAQPGLYTDLAVFLSHVFGVKELSRLIEAMRLYAEAMCCLARRLGKREVSKHTVQGPLREALSHVLDYAGVLSPEEAVAIGVGRGLEAARRRLGVLEPYSSVLVKSIEAVAGEMAEKLPKLAPSKARELAEAVLDTVYMMFLDCWRTGKEDKKELCTKLASGS